MAKMHKDYTISDMMRLGGAWVKTYNDVQSIQTIYGMLVMMDRSPLSVTIEPFMLADKTIESNVEKIRAICLGLSDGKVHEVKPPVKIDIIGREQLKQNLKNYSESVNGALVSVESATTNLTNCYNRLNEIISRSSFAASRAGINPTETSTFEYYKSVDGISLFVQSVPTNLSRVDADGTLTQRCLGRYVAGISDNGGSGISVKVVGVIDGISDKEVGGRFHPNVNSSGGVCFGDGNTEAAIATAKGDVCAVLAILDRVLRTSQYGSPYVHLIAMHEKNRRAVHAIDADIARTLLPLATTESAPNIIDSDKPIFVVPNDDIADMVSLREDGTIIVDETSNPDVYFVGNSSSVLRYAPRSMFAELIMYDLPADGVHMFANGTYVINGVAYGEHSKYKKPAQLEPIATAGLTGCYHGVIVIDETIMRVVAKLINGSIVAAVAYNGKPLRLTVARHSDVILIGQAQPAETHLALIDTGDGLLYVSGERQLLHIANNERNDSPSLEGIEHMNKYWF